MNKKLAVMLLSGVLAAGLICAIVGIIVYFTANGNAVSLLIGLFAIAMGAIIATSAALVLIVILIIHLIQKSKNK